MAFALTLALPAAFAGTWAWLAHGGAIERALASERATAEQCLATAAQVLQQELQAAAAQTGFALELGPDRRVTSDFLLVRHPALAGDFLTFRDVAAVNGTATPDRQERLADLFLKLKRLPG